MIYITQLIYIKPGEEEVFDLFESTAIPAIAKYNGRFLLRIRPTAENFIELGIESPYEIHIAEFDSEQDFEDFKNNKERLEFLHLKDQSIRSSILIQGVKI